MLGLLKLMAFIFILFGVFYAFNITPKTFIDEFACLFPHKKISLKKKILFSIGKKKKSQFLELYDESYTVLKIMGKEKDLPKLIVYAILLAMVGLVVSISMNNYILAPVLSIALTIVPFVYIKMLGGKLKKQINEELETALSIITTSYIRSENLITAVEENVKNINPPVRSVFEKFLFEIKYVSSNIEAVLSNTSMMIDNDIFKEWCDAMKACQADHTLKAVLSPIVKKLSDVKIVQIKLENILYAPLKEFITMIILLLVNIPLMYFINEDWYNILLYNPIGKGYLAICALVILISVLNVIKISKPIEYKR